MSLNEATIQTPAEIQEIVRQVVSEKPHDNAEAIEQVIGEVHRLPNYQNLVHTIVQDLCDSLVRDEAYRIKKASGYYRDQAKLKGNSGPKVKLLSAHSSAIADKVMRQTTSDSAVRLGQHDELLRTLHEQHKHSKKLITDIMKDLAARQIVPDRKVVKARLAKLEFTGDF